MDVGGDTTHHVVAGRNNRHRCDDRIDVSEGLRQLADTRQTAVQHFFTQVIQLQHHMVAIRTTTVARQDFLDHRTCNDVTTSQVLRVRRVTLHEALAMLVDQVATFTAATLGYQYTGTSDTGRVELPHLDVLHRHAGAQRHADTVTGVDQGIGGRCVDATSAASGEHGSLGADVDGFAGLDADGDDTNDCAILVLHQVDRVPLVEEYGVVLQVALIKSVQQCVTGTVCSGTGTSGLTTLTEVLGLPTERTLIDATLLGTGERQPHVLELEHRFRAYGTHVLDSVLVTDVVGTLDGIVHVPAPIIVRVGRSDGAGDATLRGNGVRASRENLGDHSGLVTGLGQLQRRAHTGATATNDDGVEGKRTNISHESDTPKNLHAPDEEGEHGNATHRLEQETNAGSPLTDRHVGQVVSRDRPHTYPRVHTQGDQSQQAEDSHPVGREKLVPLGILQPWVRNQVPKQEQKISRKNHCRNALRHPVIQTRARKVGDVGYHIHTPARTISTADTTITIFEPSLPPSSVSPWPESMIR